MSYEVHTTVADANRITVPGEQRLAVVARLHLEGYDDWEIAKLLKIPEEEWDTVLEDLETLRNRWRERAQGDIDLTLSRELAKLDHIEREAWAAWHRSVGAKRKQKIQRGESSGSVTNEEQWVDAGEARYLQVVMTCMEKRSKLLGLDKPIEHTHNGTIDVVQVHEIRQQLLNDPRYLQYVDATGDPIDGHSGALCPDRVGGEVGDAPASQAVEPSDR